MTQANLSSPTVRTGLFIGGERHDASTSIAVADPADPELTIGYAAAATAAQARAAVDAAARAFPAWSELSPSERAARLLGSLQGLADGAQARIDLLSREIGKTRAECEADMEVLARRFRLAAELAPELDAITTLPAPPYRTEIHRLALGVVTVIVPFNWPLAILGASLPYALLAGNTCVVKAPPTTPLAFTQTVELIAAALPPGVLNLVSGLDAEIGPPLIEDQRVKKIAFTGSAAAGRRIMAMAAGNLARLTLELGGNDPAILLPGASIDDSTIERLFVGAFMTTGQVCMAIKRLYVHRSLYDDVVDGLSGTLAAQRMGAGLDPRSTMGPLHHARQVPFIKELLAEAAEHAEIRELGEAVDEQTFARGQFLRPSLVLDPPHDARIVTEEQFGPALPIIPYDNVDDAVRQANDTWSGLCASVWGGDLDRVTDVARRLRTGYTFINAHNAPWLDERAPFGGFNDSGVGREMGLDGLLSFTDTHSIAYPV